MDETAPIAEKSYLVRYVVKDQDLELHRLNFPSDLFDHWFDEHDSSVHSESENQSYRIDIKLPHEEKEESKPECRECEQKHPPLIVSCLCSGSKKWVHSECLAEKRMESGKYSHCSKCEQYYVLEERPYREEQQEKAKTVMRIRRDIVLYFIGMVLLFIASLLLGLIVNYIYFPAEAYLPASWVEAVPQAVWGLFFGFVMFCVFCDLLIIGIVVLRGFAIRKPEKIAAVGGILFCVFWWLVFYFFHPSNKRQKILTLGLC
jgi:hypothetical protein